MASSHRAFFMGACQRPRDATPSIESDRSGQGALRRPAVLAWRIALQPKRSPALTPRVSRSNHRSKTTPAVPRGGDLMRMRTVNRRFECSIPINHAFRSIITAAAAGRAAATACSVTSACCVRDSTTMNNAQPTLADLPHYAWVRDINERQQPVYDPAWSGRQPPSLDPATAGAAAVAGWSLLDRLRGGISAEEARGWDEYERLSRREQCGSPCGHYLQGGSISTWLCESAHIRRSGVAHA